VTLDDLLSRGFRDAFEKRLALSVAAAQFIAVTAAPFIKVSMPFAIPALLAAACLGVAWVFLFRSKLAAWTAANALTMLALVAAALVWVAPNVDAMSSARPLSEAVLKIRQLDEPIISTKFLIRGVTFYTHAPVRIYGSIKSFWTPHTTLTAVDGREALKQLLAERGSAIFAVKEKDWRNLSRDRVIADPDAFERIGDKVLVRAVGAPTAPAGAQR
jgi:hypothetical protein